jgi:nitric oxide reductase subunit B
MPNQERLSPWWRHAVILTMIAGFGVLLWLAARTYQFAPPIPERTVSPTGEAVFTSDNVRAGQQVFLRYGLMENGSVWGHGAYLGPDFSADYLHRLSLDAAEDVAQSRFKRSWSELDAGERSAVSAEVAALLKKNRYDPQTETLTLTEPEVMSFHAKIARLMSYFSQPTNSAGLPARYITDLDELRQLTAFFAWTAWASVANRPGKPDSYTNNFPYDPAGTRPPPTGCCGAR